MNLSYFCFKQRKNADDAELFLFLAYIPRIFDKPSLLNVWIFKASFEFGPECRVYLTSALIAFFYHFLKLQLRTFIKASFIT